MFAAADYGFIKECHDIGVYEPQHIAELMKIAVYAERQKQLQKQAEGPMIIEKDSPEYRNKKNPLAGGGQSGVVEGTPEPVVYDLQTGKPIMGGGNDPINMDLTQMDYGKMKADNSAIPKGTALDPENLTGEARARALAAARARALAAARGPGYGGALAGAGIGGGAGYLGAQHLGMNPYVGAGIGAGLGAGAGHLLQNPQYMDQIAAYFKS